MFELQNDWTVYTSRVNFGIEINIFEYEMNRSKNTIDIIQFVAQIKWNIVWPAKIRLQYAIACIRLCCDKSRKKKNCWICENEKETEAKQTKWRNTE